MKVSACGDSMHRIDARSLWSGEQVPHLVHAQCGASSMHSDDVVSTYVLSVISNLTLFRFLCSQNRLEPTS